MNLTAAAEGREHIIQRIETDDAELNAFLFSLGCYIGEPITVVSRRKGGAAADAAIAQGIKPKAIISPLL